MQNTANGAFALSSNTLGHDNTAIGSNALLGNSTGTFNIGLGVSAGTNLTTGSNNIAIGNYGVAGESNTIRIGQAQTRTFINGISGVVIAGAAVVVNANGQLGVVASSADFKHQIRPMAEESKAILALKPVSFCYDQDIDENGLPQFGLVAEDVAKVSPDLVARDGKGKPYTVRYDAVNAMLLNEFLKEHRTVQELRSVVAKQEAAATQQQKQIEALTAGLQKVSAQVELNKLAPQTAKNDD
jgi:trimeric autotransporter adhesin